VSRNLTEDVMKMDTSQTGL